jgi:hypothetical protein
MLISSGCKKIVVCAPSNAAVDEIILRFDQKGFVGKSDSFQGEPESQADGLMVRIGAMEHDPVEAVKRHSLDERLSEQMQGKKE